MPSTLLTTDLPLPGRRQGKVRDVYEARTVDGQDALLIVASDRISAFDVVMANAIPDKGRVLTQLSAFWFEIIDQALGDRLEHHLLSTDPAAVAGLSEAERRMLAGRVMVGRRTRVVPIECVVRGYLAGSGWAEYRDAGRVGGIALPPGLRQCEKLDEPIFTPATKAETGHDENITFDEACARVGDTLMRTLRELSLAIYRIGHEHAAQRGIILADTKFEFGLVQGLEDDAQKPILIDEVLTPDSSRFWPADEYEPGRDQASFDKQYVRNYLQELVDAGRWDKQPPGPKLPEEVVTRTRDKYLEAYRRLTQGELELT